MTPSPHILVVDDHPLFREAMALVIRAELPDSRLSEASTLPAALDIVARSPAPDLVLLDLNLPGVLGLDGLASIRDALPDTPLVIISAEEDKQLVLRAVNAGAVGYIPKSSPRERMRQALRQVLEGNIYLPPDIIRGSPSSATSAGSGPPLSDATLERLTDRQRRVLERMALGESNKQIAWALNITETTVKAHVSAILGKLGVTNRVQAVLVAGEWLERQKSRPAL
ncbi:response regulator transcription factor [Marinobacter sp. OP 3.4]|uniref:response regulator transcription factor n=1 Tax=Marinobacter sp. OP 3.4 TaxID=3076501 RepID=UPI002E1CD089